ncbi:hypothetical protein E6C76_15485 [Pseudothauera nasutitermitis]|uniref:Uncharacterized protein n=1 Tax=Pseudothauera nasutitermitis TaxID=2565930 RepID=A0A4S4AVD5_9RHOO|nr:hypothetical protein E6C76_15485 [Pseudothauera nasutitermitis]
MLRSRARNRGTTRGFIARDSATVPHGAPCTISVWTKKNRHAPPLRGSLFPRGVLLSWGGPAKKKGPLARALPRQAPAVHAAGLPPHRTKTGSSFIRTRR